MNRDRTLITALTAVCLLGAALLVLRPFESRLPGNAVAGVEGYAPSSASLEQLSRASFNAPLNEESFIGLVDTLVVSQAVVRLGEREGIVPSRLEIKHNRTEVGPGFTAAQKQLWWKRLAVLDRYASQKAGRVERPSASVVERRARALQSQLSRPEQRSYIEVQNRSRAKVMRAWSLLPQADEPMKVAVRYSDSPSAAADGGSHQSILASELSSQARRAVFTASRLAPTYPRKINGRWRTYLVFAVQPAFTPSLQKLREQVRYQMSQGAWNDRYEKARDEFVGRAKGQVTCDERWFTEKVCGKSS